MFEKLKQCTIDLTPEDVLLLNFKLSRPTPFNHLPIVWFTGHVLMTLWFYRQKKRICQLNEIRTDLEAKINMLRETRYKEMGEFLLNLLVG